MNKPITLLFLIFAISCQPAKETKENVVTADIDLFWKVYDEIIKEPDTLKQVTMIESLYLEKGSVGLQKMVDAKNYTSKDYIDLINNYPKFWASIRENTLKSKDASQELDAGIEKLRAIYPELKPAQIFFTIGAFRSNGTTQGNTVLIGCELAMADLQTDISEFEGRTKEWLETYFGSDPLNGLVLLNIHEYIHTQQTPIPSNLLHQVLYEGVAEFVSVTAMGVPSNAPAIEYGKNNPRVKNKFKNEMFFERTHEWLWSNATNEFNVRDLGYYIGYSIAEMHYEKSEDKELAIKELINIDYANSGNVDFFINSTGFFSQPISALRFADKNKRPKVIAIKEFRNGSQDVDPKTKEITIVFSEDLNGHNTGVDYGPLGASSYPKFNDRLWAEDGKSYTFKVDLEPAKEYQFTMESNFRTEKGMPLMPFVVDFKTGGE